MYIGVIITGAKKTLWADKDENFLLCEKDSRISDIKIYYDYLGSLLDKLDSEEYSVEDIAHHINSCMGDIKSNLIDVVYADKEITRRRKIDSLKSEIYNNSIISLEDSIV